MMFKRFCYCLLVASTILTVSLPAQAAMVGTSALQSDTALFAAGALEAKRDWIREQLVRGGVAESAAVERVASMTDAQVTEVYQRIDESPAGGASALVVVLIVLIVLEITGYTDFIKD